jgi:hypothetical protein
MMLDCLNSGASSQIQGPFGGLLRVFDGKFWHSARLISVAGNCAHIRFLFKPPAAPFVTVLMPHVGQVTILGATQEGGCWRVFLDDALPNRGQPGVSHVATWLR